MSGASEFSTYQFFPDGYHEVLCRFVRAEQAMEAARMVIQSIGGRIGTTQRVIITDGGDCTVFEWKHGEGVVWPLECAGLGKT